MTKKILQKKWLLTTIILVAAMLMPTAASAAITPSKPTSGDGTLTDGTAKNGAACAKLRLTTTRTVINSV